MGTDQPPVPGSRVLSLTPPLSEERARDLRVGDEVWVDGVVWGVRDATLIRMFDQGDLPPVDLSGALLLHTAPSVRPGPNGGWVPVSVGTTTSTRMDRFTEGCVATLGARGIIGKGGLSEASADHLAARGAVYLAITGGAASPETQQIAAIEEVYYEDLMPECLWKFRVAEFGPLFVAIDATGASQYATVAETARRNTAEAYRILGITPP